MRCNKERGHLVYRGSEIESVHHIGSYVGQRHQNQRKKTKRLHNQRRLPTAAIKFGSLKWDTSRSFRNASRFSFISPEPPGLWECRSEIIFPPWASLLWLTRRLACLIFKVDRGKPDIKFSSPTGFLFYVGFFRRRGWLNFSSWTLKLNEIMIRLTAPINTGIIRGSKKSFNTSHLIYFLSVQTIKLLFTRISDSREKKCTSDTHIGRIYAQRNERRMVKECAR